MEEQRSGKGNRKKIALIVAGVCLLLVCGIAGFLLLSSGNSGSGATVGSYDSMSKEEIQAQLDQQARDSMMTISLDMTPTVSENGAKLAVHVENVPENRFSQVVEVSQGGKTIGSYKGLKPGEKLDEIDVENCTTGAAVVTISAMDDKTDEASGNPSSFQVDVVADQG